jgi:hypothetical protein
MFSHIVPEVAVARSWVVAACIVGVGAQTASAVELTLARGPTFYTAVGSSSLFAAPILFCPDQVAQPMRSFYMVFDEPESFEPYEGCSTPSPRANLVLERLQTAHLPAIGSTATILVRLTVLRFVQGFMFDGCNDDGNEQWLVDTQSMQRANSVGTMTIRRDRDLGGTLDLLCVVYVDYDFEYYWFGLPFHRWSAVLGPYTVQARGVPWNALPSGATTGAAPCPDCAGNFFVGAMTLSGFGTSRGDESDDSIRLQDSEMHLVLTPACSAPTPVRPATWSRTKAFYR